MSEVCSHCKQPITVIETGFDGCREDHMLARITHLEKRLNRLEAENDLLRDFVATTQGSLCNILGGERT